MLNSGLAFLDQVREHAALTLAGLTPWLKPENIIALSAIILTAWVTHLQHTWSKVQHEWTKLQVADQVRKHGFEAAAQIEALNNTYLHIFRVVAYSLESLIAARRLVTLGHDQIDGEQAARLMGQVIAFLSPCGREMREFVFRPDIDLAASRIVSDGAHNLEYMLWAMGAVREAVDARAVAIIADTLDKGIDDFWHLVKEVAGRLPKDLQDEARAEVKFRTRDLAAYHDDLKRSAKGLDEAAAQLVMLKPAGHHPPQSMGLARSPSV